MAPSSHREKRQEEPRQIRCLCNTNYCMSDNTENEGGDEDDEQQQPPKTTANNDTASKQFCITKTMCMTKRVKLADGSTHFKYYCDQWQDSENSLRKTVLDYRDCRINTTNKEDYDHVVKQSYEYCCNDSDMCNKDLKPVVATFDLQDAYNDHNNKKDQKWQQQGGSSYGNKHQNPNGQFDHRQQQQHHHSSSFVANDGNGSQFNTLTVYLCLASLVLVIASFGFWYLFVRCKKYRKKLKHHHHAGGGVHHHHHRSLINSQQQEKLLSSEGGGPPAAAIVAAAAAAANNVLSSSTSTSLMSKESAGSTSSTGSSRSGPAGAVSGDAMLAAVGGDQHVPNKQIFPSAAAAKNLEEIIKNNLMGLAKYHDANTKMYESALTGNAATDGVVFELSSATGAPNITYSPLVAAPNFNINKVIATPPFTKMSSSSNISTKPIVTQQNSQDEATANNPENGDGGGSRSSCRNSSTSSSNSSGSSKTDAASATPIATAPASSTSQQPLQPQPPRLLHQLMSMNSTTTTSSPSSASVSSPRPPLYEYEWSGSGSGSGYPECVQRTIARQIKLIYPAIGKGRFGEVYKGEWRGEYVAVKTFNSADEKSWENECNIYKTNGFRHENILGFIAADNIDRGTYTELWIITDYHDRGSLYDYLNENLLRPSDALKMALAIVKGLEHLHMPIESQSGKPALAHCDLKSKNILVKTVSDSEITCCIGDLGLALCGDKDGRIINTGKDVVPRTGTKRYMAPEVLAKTIDYTSLGAFQSAEMYSLSLIFWELLRRCRLTVEDCKSDEDRELLLAPGTNCNDYRLPYYEYVPADPDEAQMREVVCDRKCRPGLNAAWQVHFITRNMAHIMEELWAESAPARSKALRVKKSLVKIRIDYALEGNSSSSTSTKPPPTSANNNIVVATSTPHS